MVRERQPNLAASLFWLRLTFQRRKLRPQLLGRLLIAGQFVALLLHDGGGGLFGEGAAEQALQALDLGLGFGQVFLQAGALFAGVDQTGERQVDFDRTDNQGDAALGPGGDKLSDLQGRRIEAAQRGQGGGLLAQNV